MNTKNEKIDRMNASIEPGWICVRWFPPSGDINFHDGAHPREETRDNHQVKHRLSGRNIVSMQESSMIKSHVLIAVLQVPWPLHQLKREHPESPHTGTGCGLMAKKINTKSSLANMLSLLFLTYEDVEIRKAYSMGVGARWTMT